MLSVYCVLPGDTLTSFITECHRLSPNITDCLLVSLCITVYHRLSPCVTVCHRVSPCITRYHRLGRCVTNCHRVSPSITVCHGPSAAGSSSAGGVHSQCENLARERVGRHAPRARGRRTTAPGRHLRRTVGQLLIIYYITHNATVSGGYVTSYIFPRQFFSRASKCL